MKTVRVAGKQYAVVVLGPVSGLRPTGVGNAEDVSMIQVLVLESGHTVVGRGQSFCSPRDTFDSRKGVEIALRRALQDVRVDDPNGSLPGNPFNPKLKPLSHRAYERALSAAEPKLKPLRLLTSEEKEPFYRLVLGKIRTHRVEA